MGRQLKRVPLDFDWPLHVIWAGYTVSLCHEMETYYDKKSCERCHQFQKIMGIKARKDSELGCPERTPFDPPIGPGYQLWEDVTEGSPISPVFKTINELANWCEGNATTFGSEKASRVTWKKMLLENNVHHQEGNLIFM